MISKIKLYEVTNTSHSSVGRGGHVVPPKSTVKIKTSEYKIKEFKASSVFKVKEVEESNKETAPKENPTSKYRINESGRLQCPYCSNDYKTEDGIEKHVADKHPKEVEETEAGDE